MEYYQGWVLQSCRGYLKVSGRQYKWITEEIWASVDERSRIRAKLLDSGSENSTVVRDREGRILNTDREQAARWLEPFKSVQINLVF